jgi:deferrochelatase/peroxidase EfeB
MVVAVMFTQEQAAWCGVAAPILLGVYLAAAARLRLGYDPSRETMSKLGDGVDIAALGFLVVNLLVSALLFIFGWWAVRPGYGGDVGWLVVATAIGSVVIAVTPGDEECFVPGFFGRPVRWFHTIHVVIGGLIIVAMGAIPWVTWFSGTGEHSEQFRLVNGIIAIVFPIVAAAVVALLVLGNRQLRARLFARGGPAVDDHVRPWDAPAVWLDRWGIGERALWAVGYCWVIAAASETLSDDTPIAATTAFLLLAVVAITWPNRVVPLVRFSVETCQENTVYGLSRLAVGEFRFHRITDAAAFKTSLSSVLAAGAMRGDRRRPRRVSNGKSHTLTLGLTYAGLETLGVPYRSDGPRHDVFKEGMWMRRALLGDEPGAWGDEWRDVHVGMWAYARDEQGLEQARAEMARFAGLEQAMPATRARQVSARDPLAFRVADGISQPWVLGVPPPTRGDRRQRIASDPRGGGKIGVWGRWQPLALGEFVLGQVDEANDVAPLPDPSALFLGATFAAIRKLEIKRGRLDRVLSALSAGGSDEQRNLERLVGRTVDGTPLATGARDRNRFRYENDPDGLACPVTAHIRRANPRDALGFEGVLANRRRMIRRGIMYTDDGAGKLEEAPLDGLMFVALQARLDDQFEFVQRQWLNGGAAFGLGRDPDVLAGHWTGGPRQVVLPTPHMPDIAAVPNPVVVARGGGYFLVPSMRGLHYLASGP